MADKKPEDQAAQAQQAGPAEAKAAAQPAGRDARPQRGDPDPAPPGPAPEQPPAAPDRGGVRGGRLTDVAEPAPPPGVPYVIADHDLFIGNPESGAAPARAFAPGDRVPRDLADTYDWHDLCHVPEWAAAPPPTDTGTAAGSEE